MDRLKNLREKSRQLASKELIQVLDSAYTLQEHVYHGAVPGDQYIKLPRVHYNITERSPHLGNQRLEKGPVNVRAFRIPTFREQTDGLLRSAHHASMERAFGETRNSRLNIVSGPSVVDYAGSYHNQERVQEPFNEYESIRQEAENLKAIILEQKDKISRLQNEVEQKNQDIARVDALAQLLYKKYQRIDPNDPELIYIAQQFERIHKPSNIMSKASLSENARPSTIIQGQTAPTQLATQNTPQQPNPQNYVQSPVKSAGQQVISNGKQIDNKTVVGGLQTIKNLFSKNGAQQQQAVQQPQAKNFNPQQNLTPNKQVPQQIVPQNTFPQKQPQQANTLPQQQNQQQQYIQPSINPPQQQYGQNSQLPVKKL